MSIRIDLDKLRGALSPEELAIVRRIIAHRGKNEGCLRTSKPPVIASDPLSGKAAYVWRMVAFYLSPDPRHQHLPVTAEWDVPDPEWSGDEDAVARFRMRRQQIEELDRLVDLILDTIPPSEWHGVKRWGRLLR